MESKYSTDPPSYRHPDRLIRVGPGVTLLGEMMRRSGWTYEQCMHACEIATARHDQQTNAVSDARAKLATARREAEADGASPEEIEAAIAAGKGQP